jgi:hypothetical protein
MYAKAHSQDVHATCSSLIKSPESRFQPTAPMFSMTLSGLEALGIGKTILLLFTRVLPNSRYSVSYTP